MNTKRTLAIPLNVHTLTIDCEHEKESKQNFEHCDSRLNRLQRSGYHYILYKETTISHFKLLFNYF